MNMKKMMPLWQETYRKSKLALFVFLAVHFIVTSVLVYSNAEAVSVVVRRKDLGDAVVLVEKTERENLGKAVAELQKESVKKILSPLVEE